MRTLKIVKKLMDSHWIFEKCANEILERLPLNLRFGISYGPVFRYWLGFLKESEQWDREKIEVYQIEQLKDILIHAGENVPYYKRIFHEYGFKPKNLQSLNDIKVLPYTDREMVRDNISDFLPTNIPLTKLFKKHTSGSTGIPLAIYSDKEAEEKHWATVVYAWSKVGYSPKSKMVIFWNTKQKIKRYGNKIVLSRYYFNDEPLQRKFIKLIRKFEPAFVFGIPTALFALSNFMKEKNIPPFKNIKACIVESDTLYSWQKAVIEEMFDTSTYMTYGMVEKVIYASQCLESTIYHFYPQYGIPEPNKINNNMLEIVGTGLINYANPLIRYRTSDIGILNTRECSKCSSLYQSLDLLKGRVKYLLLGKSGKLYTPLTVGVDSRVFENVKIFQFYQDTPGEVVLRIVRKESFSESDLNRIREKVTNDIGLIGDDLRIEPVFVKDISQLPSGKFSMVHQILDIHNILSR